MDGVGIGGAFAQVLRAIQLQTGTQHIFDVFTDIQPAKLLQIGRPPKNRLSSI